MKIPFHIPYLTGDEQQEISKTIDALQLNSSRSFIEDCESKLSEITNTPYVLLTGSCTHAMEMSLMLLEIKAGDEIICPSFTYVSVVNVIIARGGTPVFVDCRLDNCNIDESLIQKAITTKTKAIIIMHYAGIACDMDRILAISKEKEISLIEDAAHCIYAYHEDKHLGSKGDFGTISFHKTKNIHCIQGGALLIKNKKDYERAIIIRDKGTNKHAFANGKVNAYTWVDVGNSFGINPMSAAFLHSQLQNVAEVVDDRKRLWQLYNEQLAKVNPKWYKPPTQHNAHIYYIMSKHEVDRKQLISHLKEGGVDARFHYMPLHSSEMGNQYTYVHDNDNSSDVSKRIVRLPLYNGMTLDEINYVVNQISTYYNEI